jgi:hypothetical protein
VTKVRTRIEAADMAPCPFHSWNGSAPRRCLIGVVEKAHSPDVAMEKQDGYRVQGLAVAEKKQSASKTDCFSTFVIRGVNV